MGEVYKARDTRLDRIVAIKISNERLTDRFQRETHAVASLNHPQYLPAPRHRAELLGDGIRRRFAIGGLAARAGREC